MTCIVGLVAKGEVYETFPDMSKIELFARKHFAGWDAWGNEV